MTDLRMPEMDGTVLAQKVLAIRPDIPVILCTGYHDPLNVNKAAKIGIKKIILKPLSIGELSTALRHVFDSDESNCFNRVSA